METFDVFSGETEESAAALYPWWVYEPYDPFGLGL
ncbi:MAG: hypothetical protein JWM27_1472 [Gemmatimonadetes bacterium]|nr:hypothetical protein [Gemmatimonadota bacterium]